MKKRLLIAKEKGHSLRLLDLDDGLKEYRAITRDNPDLVVGGLLLVESFETTGNLIDSMNVLMTVKGDVSKERVEIDVKETRIGDLIDGVPILSMGKRFYKKGREKAYAYFTPLA